MAALKHAQYNILLAEYRTNNSATYATTQAAYDALGIVDPSDPANIPAEANFVENEGVTLSNELNASTVAAADKEFLSSAEIFDAIEQVAWDGLDQATRDRVLVVLGLGDNINVGPSSKARTWLVNAFPNSGDTATTRNNLLALVTNQTQSKMQELGLPPSYPGIVLRLARDGRP